MKILKPSDFRIKVVARGYDFKYILQKKCFGIFWNYIIFRNFDNAISCVKKDIEQSLQIARRKRIKKRRESKKITEYIYLDNSFPMKYTQGIEYYYKP